MKYEESWRFSPLRLFNQFESNAKTDWPWLENALNYANGKLSHALLLSGQWLQNSDMVDMGLRSLKWLLAIQTESGHFSPIGNNGWYKKNGPKGPFRSAAHRDSCHDRSLH